MKATGIVRRIDELGRIVQDQLKLGVKPLLSLFIRGHSFIPQLDLQRFQQGHAITPASCRFYR